MHGEVHEHMCEMVRTWGNMGVLSWRRGPCVEAQVVTGLMPVVGVLCSKSVLGVEVESVL